MWKTYKKETNKLSWDEEIALNIYNMNFCEEIPVCLNLFVD